MPDLPLGIEVGGVNKAIKSLAPTGHIFQGREDKQGKQGTLDPCLSHETKSFLNNLAFYRYLLNTDSVPGPEETSHQVEWRCPSRNSYRMQNAFTNQADLCFNRWKEASVFWGHSADSAEAGDEGVSNVP